MSMVARAQDLRKQAFGVGVRDARRHEGREPAEPSVAAVGDRVRLMTGGPPAGA